MSDSQQLPDPTVLEPAPLCPWCGAAQGDAWELGLADGDRTDDYCGECNKPITIECAIAVDYTTSARGETEHTDCPKKEKQ